MPYASDDNLIYIISDIIGMAVKFHQELRHEANEPHFILRRSDRHLWNGREIFDNRAWPAILPLRGISSYRLEAARDAGSSSQIDNANKLPIIGYIVSYGH